MIRCGKCGETKPDSKFGGRGKSRPGKRKSKCKKCEWEYEKERRKKHPPKHRVVPREQQRANDLRYRLRHPERKSQIWKRYYMRNKEKLHGAVGRWQRTVRGKWKTLKAVANRRGIPCDISLEEYAAIIAPGFCVYCSGPLSPTNGSLDRKDNSLGYVITNVVPCCQDCNSIKFHLLSHSEMLSISHVLQQSRIRRQNERP